MTVDLILERLRDEGCRITKQRRIILEVIMNNRFSSCKEIYYQVTMRDRSIGMATVYRMIRQLEDLDIINRIDTIEIKDI